MEAEELHRVAVELVIVDKRQQDIVVLQRGEPPAEGMWTLPAGHVNYGEQVYEAARREAQEETGLEISVEALLGLWDAPDRDPRGPVISHGLLCQAHTTTFEPGAEAMDVAWRPIDTVDGLPLKQDEIVAAAREVLGNGDH